MKITFNGSVDTVLADMQSFLDSVYAREEASDVPSRSTDVGHEGPEGEAELSASTASPPDSFPMERVETDAVWQSIPVGEIGLSTRATNALTAIEMNNLGDLVKVAPSAVTAIPGVPVSAIPKIREIFTKFGVAWFEAPKALAIDTPLSDMPLSGKKPAPAPVSTSLFDEVEVPADGPTQEEVHTALLDVAKTDGQGPAAAKALMAKYGATMSDGIKAGDRAAVIADAQTLVGA